MDKSHLSESTSTTTNLNETCSLVLHLDSSSLSSELQDTTSVESVEIEFVPDSEEPLESNKFSPTDVFSVQHNYDLFLLNQEIDTPSDNLNHQDTHVCEEQGQYDFLIHATDLGHNFSLPQFMTQHNCENLKPIDTPSTFSTFTQASSDHTSNPFCAHNSMATQCNQFQYPTLLKQICVHNPSASQVSQANLSNSLTSQYPPDPGEHVLKVSATEIGEQDSPVKWFKFIYPISKPRMSGTSTLTPVLVAYSPIVFMNHQWTINLHDGYPLSMFCYQRSTSHPLFPPSVTSNLPCFTLVLISSIPPHCLNMIFQVKLHQKGRWQVLLVGLDFSKVPHQALYVLVILHFQSSIKSSCCVKLSFVSPSFIMFGTSNSLSLQTLLSLFQDLLPTHTKFPTATPT